MKFSEAVLFFTVAWVMYAAQWPWVSGLVAGVGISLGFATIVVKKGKDNEDAIR